MSVLIQGMVALIPESTYTCPEADEHETVEHVNSNNMERFKTLQFTKISELEECLVVRAYHIIIESPYNNRQTSDIAFQPRPKKFHNLCLSDKFSSPEIKKTVWLKLIK